ncbi:MAG: chemotaxis protein [Thalassobius sp.]|nr:chemotaxis protein [Thalassovita sp.]
MKFTIKAKLILATIVQLSAALVVFYIGNNNAYQLNKKIDEIIKVNTQRINLSAKIAEDVQFITKREKDLILSKDREVLMDLVKQVDARTEDMENRYAELKDISDEKGVEILDNFQLRWSEYTSSFAKIKSLSMGVKNDSTEQLAYEISSTTARQKALEAVTIVSQIVRKNEKALEAANLETNALYESGERLMWIILGVSLLVATVLAFWIIITITSSIHKAMSAIKAVSEGDLTVNIESTNKDEIGDLLEYLKDMIVKLKEVITFVSTAADQIAAASEQMSSSSQQMSQGSTEQAASTEEVSSSMEEMVSNIQQNTENAQATEKIAIKASDDIREGSHSVNETVQSMKLIANKISIISEIARQTNLLALNAAVEAARAGEHGKGFAVVAAEVRKLAERSQVAATEINTLSSSSVETAVTSGRLLVEIVPNIQKTASLVQEIAAASIEQNSGASQVNSAIQQLNLVVQSNAATSEEMSASAEELANQASELREAIIFFNVGNNLGKKSRRKVKPRKKKPEVSEHMIAAKSKKSSGVVLDMDVDDDSDEEYEQF